MVSTIPVFSSVGCMGGGHTILRLRVAVPSLVFAVRLWMCRSNDIRRHLNLRMRMPCSGGRMSHSMRLWVHWLSIDRVRKPVHRIDYNSGHRSDGIGHHRLRGHSGLGGGGCLRLRWLFMGHHLSMCRSVLLKSGWLGINSVMDECRRLWKLIS